MDDVAGDTTKKTILQRPGWTQGQLQQYLQIITEKDDAVVVDGYQPSSHEKTSVVQVPVASAFAPVLISHEAGHLKYSNSDAPTKVKSDAERLILNALEDARDERLLFRHSPGLRPQFQELIDAHFVDILPQEATIQALKAIYMSATGYSYDRKALKPSARRVVERFEKSAVPALVRKAQSEDDLLPLIPQVLRMFEEPIKAPRRQPGQSQPSKPNPDAGPFDGIDGSSEGQPSDDEQGEGEGQGEGGERGENEADDGAGDQQQGGNGGGVRNPQEYDATNRQNLNELNKRLGNKGNRGPSAPTQVKGFDKVKGGASVNRLMEQGYRAAQKMRQLEMKKNQAAARLSPELGGAAAVSSGGPAPDVQKGNAASLPKSIANDVLNLDNSEANNKPALDYYGRPRQGAKKMNLRALFDGDAKSTGGVGYGVSSSWVVTDIRSLNIAPDDKAEAQAVSATYAAISNYLSHQLRVFMQSKGRTAPRIYERWGRIDPRRISGLATGSINVFKQHVAPSDRRPAVVLTVDMSGSMSGGQTMANLRQYGAMYGPQGRDVEGEWKKNSAAYHSFGATIVMGEALRKLGIPFEVQGFGSNGWLFKSFSDPWIADTVEHLTQLYSVGDGGTQAPDGLAVAWARILTRPEPRKIVIQVTDGGVPAQVKEMCKFIEGKGGIVVGVGIGMSGQMKHFYNHFVEVPNASALPSAFGILLRDLLPSGEWR